MNWDNIHMGIVKHTGIISSGKLLSPWVWRDTGEEMIIVDGARTAAIGNGSPNRSCDYH